MLDGARLVERSPEYLVVLSATDPVASAVGELWGALPRVEGSVEGAPLRQLGPRAWVVKRPGRHIHDDHLERLLPPDLVDRRPTLVFPSIHRSVQNVQCLTVHPLGNLGDSAEVGGQARTVDPTDPRRMTAVLRRLAEGRDEVGLPVTYEATHHGPTLGLPAFYVEIGFGDEAGPPADAVRLLATACDEIEPDAGDRIALGIGGGHYAPHFTDLALRRRWAFGHLLSRHALETIDAATARAAWDATPGAEGIVFARAHDADDPRWSTIGARLRDQDAPPRAEPPTSASRSASGT